MSEQRIMEFETLPSADSHRLIDFERAEVVTLESFPPQFVLTVSGTKHLNSIGGPGLVEGPLQTYDVVRLRGTATQAD